MKGNMKYLPMEVPDDFEENQVPDIYGKTLKTQLRYPREKAINEIQVELVDLRWPESIKIRYDFDRDGWIILQPYYDDEEFEIEPDWREVAFIPAQDKWEVEDSW
jgi:hypothetical protein